MKNLYLITVFIAYCLSISFSQSQYLVWDYTVTDANMTIALIEGSVVLDGVELEEDEECLVGVFYADDNGDLTCGGYTDLSVFNAALAAWGNDGTSGTIDGFSAGEEMNFFLNMNGVDYPATSITWASGNNSYSSQGMAVVSTIEFSSAQIELDPCTCIDGTIGTQSGGYCILPGSYCADPTADNYCNVEGFTVIANGVPFASEDCVYGAVTGCTCPLADNYNPEAGSDDGSCYMEEGCSNPLANNYSLSGCSNVTIASEYCDIPGCTCPEAINYDVSATADDGTCVSVVSICIDPLAINFNEGCANTIEYAASSCEYTEVGCELENIEWGFTVTDANMTIQVGTEVVLLNGSEPPCGSLLGAFFTNNEGQLQNAGYQTWCDDEDNNQLAIPLWASESGEDNGFETGEEITWLLYVGNQTFIANSIVMTNAGPFSETFVANGFGQLTTASYECEVIGVLGCTDTTAYNYNSEATLDDGSCYNLDWNFTVTDCNMTILLNTPEIESLEISLNGSEIPSGAMIGVFYENTDGEMVCGGASEWTGTSGAVAAMGSEAGLDNGFQTGELLNTWFLLIGDQTIPMDSNGAVMSNSGAFQDNYVCNGFGNLLSVNFEGEYTLTYGCTDMSACNYDSSAILDDDSCDYGQTWYQDSDGDGLGNPDVSTTSCSEITGFVTNNDDPCPDNLANPNNSTEWYIDEDGDGLGTGYIYTAYGCNPPGPDFSDIDGDPCPYDPTNEDIDQDGVTDCADNCVGQIDQLGICNGDCSADDDGDGICDDIDDCVGEYDNCGICNGPGDVYECGCEGIPEGDCDCEGNVLDAISVCGGNCSADQDGDGICDDVDDCVGQYDNCGICNGPGEIYECGCADIPQGNCDCEGNVLDAISVCGGNCSADEDGDAICDDVDDCVGQYDNCGICNGPGEIYECGCADIPQGDCDCEGNILDALLVCGGDCVEDNDGDAICDDVDDCVGQYDALDICNGDCPSDEDEDGVCDNNEIPGCTNPIACNYSPTATDDDGSCDFGSCSGCTDPTACNYAPNATIDDNASCNYLFGCTDPTACNYVPNAECDDTSCTYPITWYIDNDGDDLGFDGLGLFSFESCNDNESGYSTNNDDENDGDFDNDGISGINFNGNDCDDTNINIGVPEAGYDCNGVCLNDEDDDGVCDEFDPCLNDPINDPDGDGVCDIDEVYGCGDANACNYNTAVTEDDASCTYLDGICETCDNGIVIDNDSDNDEICDNNEIVGCQDTIACNYDETATDEGECVYLVEFYDCDNNCLNDADGDGVCDELEIIGCTDISACSYNEEATDDCDDFDNDGVLDCCTYLQESCDTCEGGVVIDNDIDNDGVCNDEEIPGCTDPTACNFDPNLGCTDDDGSCFYSEITVSVSTQDASCEAICDGVIELTINNGQPPYNVEYNLVDADGNVETTITAGSLTTACAGNYGVLVSDVYNCESEMMMIIVGAEEPDSDDDGVCDNDEVEGCIDPSACNYNSVVTEDDGSCEYCSSNLGDIDGNGFDDCELINNQSIADGNLAIYDCDGCISDSDFDGVCDELEVIGCTDNSACNYDDQATEDCEDLDDDGVLDCCNYPIYYLDCEGNCLNDIDGDGICDEIEVTGCNDASACNYDATATEDTDCIYPIEFYDCENVCLNDVDNDAVCDEIEVTGCQDGSACNYNPEATDPCTDCCAFLDGDGDGFPNFITVLETVQDINCPGDGNGGFVLYTNGGLSPYTLTVDGQELTSDDGIFSVPNLSGGSYNVSVVDSNGCETIQAVDIQEPNPIDITIEYLNYVSCEGYGDGSLTNSIQGGTPPYDFEWVDAGGTVLSTEQDIFNLDAGAYAVNVIDYNNCAAQAAFIVGDPNPLDLSITYTDVTCYGGNDGSANLFITGGSSPYTEIYTDSNSQVANPNALSAGAYVITITDNNGCIFVDEVTIDEPSLLEVDITSTDTEMCEDDDDIIITASPSNFSNYILSDEFGIIAESTDNTLSVNESGEYFVTAVTEEGCEAISNIINIDVFENPTIDINGETDVITGNIYTYYVTDTDQEYEWSIEPSNAGTIVGSNGENNIQITWILESPGPAQIYLTQVDDNGCSSIGFIDVNVEWPTGLEDLSDEFDFIVYPNPFVNETTIEINNPNKTNYNLYLYDAKGSIVESFINQTDNKIQLTGPFSKGIYNLQLTNSQVNKRKLIIVE